jgi:hypothetical protein
LKKITTTEFEISRKIILNTNNIISLYFLWIQIGPSINSNILQSEKKSNGTHCILPQDATKNVV